MKDILWELLEISMGGGLMMLFWWWFLGTKLFEHFAWWKIYLLCALLATFAGIGIEIAQAIRG